MEKIMTGNVEIMPFRHLFVAFNAGYAAIDHAARHNFADAAISQKIVVDSVREILPLLSEQDRQAAKAALTSLLAYLASHRRRQDPPDLQGAQQALDEALSYDPDSRAAKEELERLKLISAGAASKNPEGPAP
jgi:hypothetical protein